MDNEMKEVVADACRLVLRDDGTDLRFICAQLTCIAFDLDRENETLRDAIEKEGT